MKKVVVTGMGILSAIGNGIDKVKHSLLNGVSGIKFNQEYSDLGMRSHVSGSVDIDLTELIDRKLMRFMSKAAAFGYLSAKEALTHSGIKLEELNPARVGIVAGSGGASPEAQIIASDVAREKSPKRIGPYAVTKTMGSTVSACMGTALKTQGGNYSISSACSTSCLLYTSPSPRDLSTSRMPSSA